MSTHVKSSDDDDDNDNETGIADDEEFQWYIDKDWFRSEKCLRDFVAVHASQVAPTYRHEGRPYPSVKTADMDAFMDSLLANQLNRGDDAQIEFENQTAEIGEAIEILNHLSFQRKRDRRGKSSDRDDFIGFPGAEVSSHFSHKSAWKRLSRLLTAWSRTGDAVFTNAFGTNGWFVVVDHASNTIVWFLPMSLLVCGRHTLKRLRSIARRVAESLSDGGHIVSDVRVQLSFSASSILQELLLAWAHLQYAMFHLLVFKSIFDDARTHPERWYESSTDDKEKSGLAEFVQMVRHDDDRAATIQTYIPWWWEMFQVGDAVAAASGNSRLARRVFSKLNRKLLREE